MRRRPADRRGSRATPMPKPPGRWPGRSGSCCATGTSWTGGCAGCPVTAQSANRTGVLDDYGAVAEAFCALHQLTGEGGWLAAAGGLLDTALAHFGDGEGGFFDTADFAETLVARPADPTDNASPAGVSVLAAALTAYTALSGEPAYRDAAERALAKVSGVIGKYPRYAGYACAVAEAQLSGPYEIAVVGAGAELLATAWRLAPPGAVVVAGVPDAPGVPLLADRPLVDGVATAYVCRGFVCDRPVTDARSLAAQLAGAPGR